MRRVEKSGYRAYFICFTMVLLADSPAPVGEGEMVRKASA
jgi:hypothetical protein